MISAFNTDHFHPRTSPAGCFVLGPRSQRKVNDFFAVCTCSMSVQRPSTIGYYDSEYHQQLVKDLKVAIHGGGLVAFTGIVGSGKTILLARLQQQLRNEGQIEVCESLAFEVSKVTLTTLKLRVSKNAGFGLNLLPGFWTPKNRP